MNEASISATRRYGSGGTGLVHYSLLRLGKIGSIIPVLTQIGAGIWTRFFLRINGETHYLWRAVDHEGEVLEVFVTKRRDRKAALKFPKKTMKRYGRPEIVVTDKLRSYKAAMKVIGNEARQETGRWLNNRAENSHQPFRRRERAMAKFRSVKSLLKFVSAHASIHNHFNQGRHLNPRDDFKKNRATALAEWRQLAA